MAGIGFAIKKIYKKNTLSDKTSSLVHTGFVSVGPTIVSMIMLVIMGRIGDRSGLSMEGREVMNSAIIYGFIFSLITVSGISMVLSRYVADCLFKNEEEYIFPSLVGAVGLVVLIGGIVGIGFYSFSPLGLLVKTLGYTLYIELCIMYLLMVYVSALREFKRITYGFITGVVAAILIAFVLVGKIKVEPVSGMLLSINVGFLINVVIILGAVIRYFDLTNKEYFRFLSYFKEYKGLLFINVFYTLGMFGHNFIFWGLSEYSIRVAETFRTAPIYDLTTFYGVLSIIPANILFVLRIETSFYDKYKTFLSTILYGGKLHDLKTAKKGLKKIIYQELTYIIEFQFIFSVISIIILTKFMFPYFGIPAKSGELVGMLVFGYFTAYMGFLITTILLYFDIVKDALIIQGFFFASNIVFTLITLLLGGSYYGLGFAISGIMTLLLALWYLSIELNTLDYRFFSKQPINTNK